MGGFGSTDFFPTGFGDDLFTIIEICKKYPKSRSVNIFFPAAGFGPKPPKLHPGMDFSWGGPPLATILSVCQMLWESPLHVSIFLHTWLCPLNVWKANDSIVTIDSRDERSHDTVARNVTERVTILQNCSLGCQNGYGTCPERVRMYHYLT
jgi:hypothetical protein